MDIKKLFEEHIVKAKKYVQLQSQGIPQIQAAYEVFGNEIGDEMTRLYQKEINFTNDTAIFPN